MGKSLFQTALLVLFGAALVVAVLIFAGILPGFKGKDLGQAGHLEVWGPFSFITYNQTIGDLGRENNNKDFSLTYSDKGSDLETSLINSLASGKGPDVIIAPAELILKHRDKFTPIPFSSISLRSYQDAFVDEASLFVEKDGFIAMPLAVDPLLLYYNKDLYNDVNLINPPTNWEQFVKIQPELTKIGNNNRIEQSAFALGTFGNNNNAKDILSLFILQAGGTPAVLDSGQVVIKLGDYFGYSIVPTEAALSFFLEFAAPNKATYCWNRSLPEARDSFLGEKLANYFGFASEAPYLREKNPHLNFNLVAVPQMTGQDKLTFGRLYGVAVLKSSTKAKSAWPMVFGLTGTDFSKRSATVLNFAPVRRALLVPDPAQPDQKVIFSSALISRGWFDFAPAETKNIFQTMNDNVATGRLNIQDAIRKATEEMRQLLKQS